MTSSPNTFHDLKNTQCKGVLLLIMVNVRTNYTLPEMHPTTSFPTAIIHRKIIRLKTSSVEIEIIAD